ncbi:unnamed protein product [Anisakis simplex]|uniref:DNA-directed RNA polymerase III subunit RPC3 n=1 Tax=Anisakis simplex TaxID=6269 RepID=A0A0M3JZ62_ANISI|nr:unnamed protein product [Anisakis simplex]
MSSNILGRVIRTSVNAIRPTYRGLLGIQSPLKESCAAFKVKSMLKLRCRHCYFVRVDGRLEVKCLVEACCEIIEDYFGPVVRSVANVLLCGESTLSSIAAKLNKSISISQLKRSLINLEQHNVLSYRQEDRRIIYSIKPEDVLRLLRSTRCLFIIKTLYGEVAEAIGEELVCRGRLSCSDCLRCVSDRLDAPISEIKTKFARLAEAQLVIRCAKVELYGDMGPMFEKEPDPFLVPDLVLNNIKQQNKNDSDSRKRKRDHDEKNGDSDSDILWRMNYPRFERYLRDEMVVSVVDRIDSFGAECTKTIRTLLKISELKADSKAAASFPISIQDVVRTANNNDMGIEKKDIEVALRILCDDQDQIVRRIGDSAGGLYVVDFEKAISVQCQLALESVIREKFDSLAVRIFRLLVQKGYLEEEQIEKLAMLSAKESKHLCYALLDENFISVRHIAKTNDFAPARTFCLYHVDLSDVAQLWYERTCKILRNVIVRRRHETKQNKMLIERQLKMESIIANIESDANLDEATKKQQTIEVEDMYLTPDDRTSLENYRHAQNDFFFNELELDHDLLLFSLFIDFAKRRTHEQIFLVYLGSSVRSSGPCEDTEIS